MCFLITIHSIKDLVYFNKSEHSKKLIIKLEAQTFVGID